HRDLTADQQIGGREHLAHATGADAGAQLITVSNHEGHWFPPTFINSSSDMRSSSAASGELPPAALPPAFPVPFPPLVPGVPGLAVAAGLPGLPVPPWLVCPPGLVGRPVGRVCWPGVVCY